MRTGNNNPGGLTGFVFDDMAVHIVPPTATPTSPPLGLALRTLTFPLRSIISIAQSPTSRRIYAVRNHQEGGSNILYRIDVDGPSLSAAQVHDLNSTGVIDPGFSEVQGLTFDPTGNMYISNRLGRIIKGIDTNPDPDLDVFSFSQMFDLPDPQIGTFHGVGGVAVGPDGYLYINSGSETHYGPEDDKGYNMRILRPPSPRPAWPRCRPSVKASVTVSTSRSASTASCSVWKTGRIATATAPRNSICLKAACTTVFLIVSAVTSQAATIPSHASTILLVSAHSRCRHGRKGQAPGRLGS